MSEQVCWIKSKESHKQNVTGEMKQVVGREDGTLHRLYQSLLAWPVPIIPADQFYKAILHSDDSPLGLWRAEFVATFVAILANCTYARAHHGENFLKVSPTRRQGIMILTALENDDLNSPALDPELRSIAKYTKKLSLEPACMSEDDISSLRETGFSEAEIVHINQIAASFAFWVRMINGLGISLGTEQIGMKQESLDNIIKRQRDFFG